MIQMSSPLLLAGAAALLSLAPALADVPARVRGTVTAVDAGSVKVRERAGRTFTLRTGPSTAYAEVVPSSLDAIKVNDYIGTAIKGPPGDAIAVEIVLVPDSMRAGRRGLYEWDPLPDTSGIDASAASPGAANGSPAKPGLTSTSMTNGTVVGSQAGPASKTLTVALVNDQTARIRVSPTAPVTRFVPTDRSAVSVGSATVVWADHDSQATLVAVGKGVTPPM
jgi:hypothetical protein